MRSPPPDAALAGLVVATLGVPLIGDAWPGALLLQSVPEAPYAVAAALILGAALWRWAGAGAAAAAGLAGAAVLALPGAGAPDVRDGMFLRVATWNTEYWDQTEGSEELGRLLAGLDADVLLLQEHLHWDAAARQTIAVDRAGLLRDCCGYGYVWQEGELITASRVRGHRADEAADHVLAVEIGGVRFLNVHVPVHVTRLHSPSEAAFWRFLSAASEERTGVFKAIEELAGARHRTVIGGDFNATLLMPAMRRLAWRFDLAAWPPTFPNGRLPLWRLDHLGDSAGGLSGCVSPRVPRAASDHLPVVCDLARGMPS